MKSLLNFIFSLASLAYLALFVFYRLAILGVIETKFFASEFMMYVLTYGPILLLSLFALVDFASRSIKLLFLIILIVVIIAGVLVLFFPEIFAQTSANISVFLN